MKKVFIGLAVVVLVIVSGMMIQKEFTIERSVEISRSNEKVFDYILHLKNQDEYAVWQKVDPNTKKEYVGTDGTVGFISKWSSDHEEVGVGEQEIKAIVANERIDYELRFLVPFEATNKAWMTTEDMNGATKVSWGFNGGIPFIMSLFMDMEAELGGDLQDGLNNLKSIQEEIAHEELKALQTAMDSVEIEDIVIE